MEAAVALPHALAAHSITVPHLSHNYPTSPQHSHSRPTNKARDGRDHLDGAPDVYVVGTAAVSSGLQSLIQVLIGHNGAEDQDQAAQDIDDFLDLRRDALRSTSTSLSTSIGMTVLGPVQASSGIDP